MSVAAPQFSESSVMADLEGEAQNFGQRDFRAVRYRHLDIARNAASVQPGAIAGQVRDFELAAGGVAPQAQVFARNLVGGVEGEVYPEVIAAASDGNLVLGHQERLWARFVLVATFGEYR